ncbi:hypothetical protein AJ80_04810 [Polytolypa hystricis UAMH7299]|uniref:S-adenosyl-L-methionine-dependent tRNA 4-demethylwyosine synthase n=1 Tax=Polytolypa hystricis (strain UAMH7299) TaxID=1447883 RepID=A0A2B7Y8B5_POLH7|nr:hypothetical protein AJ80_04810 [Polytolypa hystricis UAMH7299]
MGGSSADMVSGGLLSLWHSYRGYIIIAATVGILIIRLFVNSAPKSTPSASSPPPAKSVPLKAVESTKSPSLEVSREAATAPTTQSRPSSAERQKKPAQAANGPKRVRGTRPTKNGQKGHSDKIEAGQKIAVQPLVFFSSLTSTTESRAKFLSERLCKQSESSIVDGAPAFLPPQVHDLSYIDFEDYFVTVPKVPEQSPNTKYMYFILIPTYNIDSIIDNFLGHLDETHNDFRIDTAPLSGLAGFSVFGFGDKEGWPTEEEGFCSQAREVDKWMAKLTGRKRAYPLGLADVKADVEGPLIEWCDGLRDALVDLGTTGGLGEGVPGSGNAVESDEEDIDDNNPSNGDAQLVDLEDIKFGATEESSAGREALPVDFTTYSKSSPAPQSEPVKEMVPKTSPTYASLTKQGYTIVGSHSGVKICRWTKSALRGRGSCYKNSFYGIKSHLCMETTPSLSCSNKCVFCWRHGTNPVGTTWRWKVDPPELIFDGAKEGHYKKIKMLRGVPGVRAERFAEAMRIRHCALSLVGEPIFYPHINKFLSLLHREHISSFLVCNAQHPDQLAALDRVTQLYVSIDASNRESLRKIDRPLHRDFWERFQRCLDIIREKRFLQRTVYRLTLVKGFNVDDEVNGYADLVEQGLPCLIEVKGVTYCGTSTSAGAGLTMQNVPFYEEVVSFVVALDAELKRRDLGYGIAAEHAHSCCILLASNRFLVDGRWHTRIDYNKFFSLLEKEQRDGTTFRPEDYMRETEEWAWWGNGGFDPNDERVYRKGKKKGTVIPAKPLTNKEAVVEI